MELRDIEIFLTLAEELHFSKAAERLHVSVARVSQAIKKQERDVGALLFERTSRTVRLTPVGEQLRDDLQPIYRGLRESLERARQAADGKTAVLRIGMIPSNAYDLRPTWEAFRTRFPQWGLKIRHSSFIDAFLPLHAGEVDALVAWLPVERPGLVEGPVLFTEPRVLAMSLHHRLAGRESVSIEVLADFGAKTGADTGRVSPEWENTWLPFDAPSGRTIHRVPAFTTIEEQLSLLEAEQALHPLGAHAARYHARPGITFVPIHDARHLSWGLVWREGDDNPALRALAQVVRDLGTRHHDL
ncbi:LysR family transcriptional regulator [Nonomuraea endophytica]|uniref:LysR family transcriptional regulator n=1 Tax=Nonomuraea endophytica TaxID=714136 RepID=UPI0037C7BC6D